MQRLRVSSAFIVAMLTSAMLSPAAFAAPLHLRCEYLENPLGIDQASPHLSWQSDNTERDWKQSAYEILVASSAELLPAGKADIWDSGKTTSAESVGIVYHGAALESRERYYWKVRVWDAGGQESESVEAAWWEMGLLHTTDWKAKWITLKGSDDEERHSIRWIWLAGQDALVVPSETAATFRITVNLSEQPQDAFLVLSARGNLIATVNGHEVDAKNEWAAFDRRDISGTADGRKELHRSEGSNPADTSLRTECRGHNQRSGAGRVGRDAPPRRHNHALPNRRTMGGERRRNVELAAG